MAFGLQDGGFVLKRLVDIRDDLKQSVEQYLGGPIDDSGNSALGMLLGITAQGLAVLWSELSKVSDNMNPNTATGDNLLDWGRRRGLTPKPAQPMVLRDIAWTGTGSVSAGQTIEVDNVTFVSEYSFEVQGSGNHGVFVSVDAGRNSTAADTGTLGSLTWSVQAQTSGRDAETEAEFRTRVSRRISDTGCSTDSAISDELNKLPFLVDARVFSNRTMAEVNQMSPKSYEAVIAPASNLTDGQERLVFDLLFESQPAGIESNDPSLRGWGGSVITHTYSGSVPVTVNATIAQEVPVNITVTTETTGVDDAIKSAITRGFGTRYIGESVYASELYCHVSGLAKVTAISVNGGFIANINMRQVAVLGSITVDHV